MKKTILAIAIPALFASAANATVVYDKDGTTFDIYGRVQANYYGDTNEKAQDYTYAVKSNNSGFKKVAKDGDAYYANKDSELIGSSRLGWSGKIALNDTWSGIAKTEWQVSAENSDNKFNSRHVYVGLDGSKYGQFLFGQTDTAYYDALAKTDIAFEWGSNANAYDGRQEGQVIYRGKWGGLFANASYQSADSDNAIDHGYAGSLGYDFDFGLGLAVGGERKDFSGADDLAIDSDFYGLDKKGDWAVTASYTVGPFYVAGMYNQSKYDYLDGSQDKLRGYEFFANYTIDAWTLELGYNQAEKNLAGDGYKDTVEYTYLGAKYSFTPKLNSYTEYRISGISDKDDEWTVGLQYNF